MLCSVLGAVFHLYPVQENVWYLYQLCSRRSKQQRAKDNTSPGINTLQGNGPDQLGLVLNSKKWRKFHMSKTGNVGLVKSFAAPDPNSSHPTSCLRGTPQPSHFLCWRITRRLDLNKTTAAFPRFHYAAPSFLS